MPRLKYIHAMRLLASEPKLRRDPGYSRWNRICGGTVRCLPAAGRWDFYVNLKERNHG
jgi:hypothetical protein